ncbi:hypothetical protein BN7874_299 [Phage NCTB]|jgi:hypothetical protein|nr:hypothetical protein BN7874_299 [Phage NCTB]
MELTQIQLSQLGQYQDSVIIIKLFTGAELIGKVEHLIPSVSKNQDSMAPAYAGVVLRKCREVHAIPQRTQTGVTMQLSIDKPFVTLDPEGLLPIRLEPGINCLVYECPSQLEKGYLETTTGIQLATS